MGILNYLLQLLEARMAFPVEDTGDLRQARNEFLQISPPTPSEEGCVLDVL